MSLNICIQDIPIEGGGFAEYSLVNASKLSHIPPGVSFEQAAAVALAGTTAYQCLFECLNITPGKITVAKQCCKSQYQTWLTIADVKCHELFAESNSMSIFLFPLLI